VQIKNICFLIIFLNVSIASAQNATDTSQIKSVFKIYPIQVLGGELRVGFEKPLSKNLSLEFAPGYVFAIWPAEVAAINLNGESSNPFGGPAFLSYGLALRGGAKIYTSATKQNQTRFYLHPLLLYKYLYKRKEYSDPETDKYYFYESGIQFLAGFEHVNKKGRVIDFYFGVGLRQIIKYRYVTTPYIVASEKNTGIRLSPQIGYSVGFTHYKK
jgi:hypothetical protein